MIVLSDHGENFGEDGLIGHGMSLDERLIHVPFVAAGPRSDAIETNTLVDLPRELARACDIEDHPWQLTQTPGMATAQFDPPVMAGDVVNIEKLREIGIEGEALKRFVTPLTCAVQGDLKLLRRGTDEVIFDLARDSEERHPIPIRELAQERSDELRSLREALDIGGEPIEEIENGSRPSKDEVRDLEERMKLLGYM